MDKCKFSTNIPCGIFFAATFTSCQCDLVSNINYKETLFLPQRLLSGLGVYYYICGKGRVVKVNTRITCACSLWPSVQRQRFLTASSASKSSQMVLLTRPKFFAFTVNVNWVTTGVHRSLKHHFSDSPPFLLPPLALFSFLFYQHSSISAVQLHCG